MSSNNKKRMSAAKDTKGTVKRLLGYLSAYKPVSYTHLDALDFIEQKMLPEYPLGVIRDK